MAQTPKNVKVNVTPNPEAAAQLKATFQAMGDGLVKAAEQMKPAMESLGSVYSKMFNQNVLTQQQVCLAFGVPPESIGLLPPDALDGVNQAITAGTLTSEVLAPGECPANTSPYVSGQLGINSYLTQKTHTPIDGWEGKTSAEILADIQKTIDSYKGVSTMPKKVFPAKQPGEGSGIPAHAIFTSDLIHSQADAEKKAKQLLAKTGAVKVAQLDEQGNPTEWTDVGSIASMDLFFATPSAEALAANDSYVKALTTEKLDQMAQTEMQVLSSYLGVDVGKNSGNVVTVEKAQADPSGPLQITVTGPEGEHVKQVTVSAANVYALMDAAYDQMYAPVSIGQSWSQDFQVGALASGEPMELGHTEAVAEALEQKKAVDAWQAKVQEKVKGTHQKLSNHASGTALDFNGIVASGGFSAPGQMHFEVVGPPLNFPEVSTKKGGIQYPTPKHSPSGATCIPLGGGKTEVQLSGVVSLGDKGNFSLAYQQIVDSEIAEMLAGFAPIPEGVALTMPVQAAGGEMFIWNTQKGWVLADWIPAASDTVSTDQAKTTLTDSEHLWCVWHEKHWVDPAHTSGVVFECGSSQFTRPSTPLEDKQVLNRLRMLHETGLA